MKKIYDCSKMDIPKLEFADLKYSYKNLLKNIIIEFNDKVWDKLRTIIQASAIPIITDNLTEKCLNHHKIELEVEQKYDDDAMLSYYIQVKQRGEYITPRMHFFIPKHKLNHE